MSPMRERILDSLMPVGGSLIAGTVLFMPPRLIQYSVYAVTAVGIAFIWVLAVLFLAEGFERQPLYSYGEGVISMKQRLIDALLAIGGSLIIGAAVWFAPAWLIQYTAVTLAVLGMALAGIWAGAFILEGVMEHIRGAQKARELQEHLRRKL